MTPRLPYERSSHVEAVPLPNSLRLAFAVLTAGIGLAAAVSSDAFGVVGWRVPAGLTAVVVAGVLVTPVRFRVRVRAGEVDFGWQIATVLADHRAVSLATVDECEAQRTPSGRPGLALTLGGLPVFKVTGDGANLHRRTGTLFVASADPARLVAAINAARAAEPAAEPPGSA